MFLGSVSSDRIKKKDNAGKPNLRSVLQKIKESGSAKAFDAFTENKSYEGEGKFNLSSPHAQEKLKLPRLPVYDDLGQSNERYFLLSN